MLNISAKVRISERKTKFTWGFLSEREYLNGPSRKGTDKRAKKTKLNERK